MSPNSTLISPLPMFHIYGFTASLLHTAKKSNTSATMANGNKIADIVEFKKMLMKRKLLVARCLTEKMLTYATGRQLETVDRGEVDLIVSELTK